MKIKIVLDSCFKGITSGWPTRYIGLIKQIYNEHDLYIFAPGDTSLVQSYFTCAHVCLSTSENACIRRMTLIRYIMSIINPHKKTIYLPEYRYYPEYEALLSRDIETYDYILYFGISSYVFYCSSNKSVPALCDFCDSSLRHRKTFCKVTRNLKSKIVTMFDMVYIRRIKKKYFPKNVVISVITDSDAGFVKGVLKNNRVITIPNGVPSPSYQIDNELIDSKYESNVILFCGSLDYYPNINSVLYIVDSIWPILTSRFPSLELQIVGRNPKQSILDLTKNDQKIKIYKNVPDVFEYYRQAKVFLSPMFSGGGLKNKLLEAFITGTPVVTNKEGKTGVEMENGVHGYIGESKHDLITGIERILKFDILTYRKMINECVVLGKKYSWEMSGAILKGLINSTVNIDPHKM